MNRPTIDIADQRSHMVDSQLRPNKVTDARVLGAMRTLPRERFLPPALAARAYSDADVPLGGGRFLMEPMVLARLVQLADPKPGERVLAVGAGTGYGVAVLAACGIGVTALEEAEELLALARRVLAELAPGVQLVAGPLVGGWRPGAPYDLMFIEGGFEELPASLIDQVRPRGGRLVGVRLAGGRVGQGVLGERATDAPAVSLRPMFDCATPALPEMRRKPGFVF
jgi:protein-L-isoaspartate(D-aspartate) O-methyltransferase